MWKNLESNYREGILYKNTKGPQYDYQLFNHAKMGSIKDINGMELTEAEDIKNRWQEYTELYKKDLHETDNHDGVITHLVRPPGM